MRYHNPSAVPLSLAVFLAADDYDYQVEENAISVTSLIRPLRQYILGQRAASMDVSADITQQFASSLGTAIHSAIEKAWLDPRIREQALRDLGYKKRAIDNIVINPDPAILEDNAALIPVYLEQRVFKDFEGFKVNGKFDFVLDGTLEDFKSTSTFTYINGSNDEAHRLQGSIYRWLSPQKITNPFMYIRYLFTNWSAASAASDPKYPKNKIESVTHSLMSIPETEAYVRQRLNDIKKFTDADEKDLPLCTDEELWRSEPVFKYYKNPDKRSRSTKNFQTRQEAILRLVEDGSVGVVVEKPGEATRCKYCPGFALCTQKDALIASGDLQMG